MILSRAITIGFILVACVSNNSVCFGKQSDQSQDVQDVAIVLQLLNDCPHWPTEGTTVESHIVSDMQKIAGYRTATIYKAVKLYLFDEHLQKLRHLESTKGGYLGAQVAYEDKIGLEQKADEIYLLNRFLFNVPEQTTVLPWMPGEQNVYNSSDLDYFTQMLGVPVKYSDHGEIISTVWPWRYLPDGHLGIDLSGSSGVQIFIGSRPPPDEEVLAGFQYWWHHYGRRARF